LGSFVGEVNLVPSLLHAILTIDGEALVMHAGEKPYVVSPSGQVDLASRALTSEAVSGIVAQLLPPESLDALDEFGAVQYPMPAHPDFPNEAFTVAVARGEDDVWAEIRRKRVPEDDQVPDEFFAAPGTAASAAGFATSEESIEPESPLTDNDAVGFELPKRSHASDDSLALPDASQLWPGQFESETDAELHEHVELAPLSEETAIASIEEMSTAPAAESAEPPLTEHVTATPPDVSRDPVQPPMQAGGFVEPPFQAAAYQPVAIEPPVVAPVASMEPLERPALESAGREPETEQVPSAASEPAITPTTEDEPMPQSSAVPSTPPAPPRTITPPAVVLTMARNPIRNEGIVPPATADHLSGLERLLRTAAARGASTLYLASDARPSIRLDGQLQVLENEPIQTSTDVVSLLLTLMPDRSHEALRTGAASEWICDIPDIGRVRCMSFRDHRGPGGVFRLMPMRPVSVEQLGLPREVQAFVIEPEGLVLVTGLRSSGKRTLISALVDLINRTRRDHVITIEREINIVHERVSSFVSQREVRGDDEQVLDAARAALREDPDVLVIEQIRTGHVMNVALEAAASGHLVIGGFSAHSATEAIDRILDLYAPEYARQVQLALADHMRGVVAQILLPKIGGGRIAAREVLLNTPAVASLIAEGKTSQIAMAIEGGRRAGMRPLADALVGHVQAGLVDLREAYRYVTDRAAFVALLKRHGVDTSAVERLA
jgi:twitching motility protein PilT